MSRFILFSSNREFDQKIRQSAAGLPGGVRTIVSGSLPAEPQELFALLNQELPEVLILGPDFAHDDALGFARICEAHATGLSVVLVSEADPAFLLQAMRAGIKDILSPQADFAEIRVVLERATQSFAIRHRNFAHPAAESTGKGTVIGVFSPKGGVGKTTLATNIAIGLGQVAPMSVVIVDLDLQFGDVASGLYLNPQHTVTDAVSPAASQDTLVLKAYLTVHPANIYALCAPLNPAEGDLITSDQVTRLLEQLSTEFQYVVVDTAPGLPEVGLAAMEQCTDVVWVSAMDIPSLRGLRSGLEILGQLDIIPKSRHMVLNMADPKSGLSVQDVESTIGCPIDVSVPRSKMVALSTNRGIPVLQQPTRDPAAKSLQQLVQRLNPMHRPQGRRKLHRRVVI
jgi:pilus assembly protein CpaE